MEAWVWTDPWFSYANFEGIFNNGAYHQTKTDLRDLRDIIKNAIEFYFPLKNKPEGCAIWMEQFNTSY